MKSSVIVIINEHVSQMESYGLLLCFKFMNLCVKAEPAALLPISVTFEDETYQFEKVAKVVLRDWNKIEVFADSTEMNQSIQEGIFKAHPEFKQEKIASQPDVEGVEAGEDDYTIMLTMPEVNDDRYDFLTKGVDGLYTQCMARVDRLQLKCTEEITKKLASAKPEEIKEAKDYLQQQYEAQKERIDKYREDKLNEIGEAHTKYLAEEADRQKQAQMRQDAANPEVASSLKLGKEIIE